MGGVFPSPTQFGTIIQIKISPALGSIRLFFTLNKILITFEQFHRYLFHKKQQN